MENAGSMLILLGIILIIFGVLWHFNIKIGHLPGDIIIQKDNFTLYFPITTSILVSMLLFLLSIMMRQH